MKKTGQIKALKTGNGIQYLLDAAYKILGNPIVVFDTGCSLIAYAGTANEDPLWNTLVSTGGFGRADLEFFSAERFTESVANADKMVVMKSDKLKYDRVLGNIVNRERIKVARIVMIERESGACCGAECGQDFRAAFEALADKVTDEIRDDNYFTAYGRTYHDSIIKKILDQEITDPARYAAHVQILYDGFEDYLYLAVVDVQNSMNRGNPEHIRDLLMRKYPLFKFAMYSGYVLMIMSSTTDRFSPGWILGDAENPFERNNLFAVVSSSFENIYELRKYYDEAIAALKSESVRTQSGANWRRIFHH